MRHSDTPITYNGKEYTSIAAAMVDTGLSRYIIKKDCKLINIEDANKFAGHGRKPNTLTTIPTKDEVLGVYRGNYRKLAAHYRISPERALDLLEMYDIKAPLITSYDFDYPAVEKMWEFYKNNTIESTLKKYNISNSRLTRQFELYNLPKRSQGDYASIAHNTRHEEIKPEEKILREQYKIMGMHELSSHYGVDKSIIRGWMCDLGIDIIKQTSKAENRLFEILVDVDTSFQQHDRNTIAPYELDIVSHKHQIAVEYCGLYWHSHIVKKDRTYHQKKWRMARAAGIRLITVFEGDDIDKVVGLVKSMIGAKKRVFARNATLMRIDGKEATEFHHKYHLNGSVNSSINYALMCGGEMLLVGSFIKSRYDKSQYECSRMTTHPNIRVVGGVSKIFKHFFIDFKVDTCVTYADLRYGDGASYKHCGFELSHISQPNYFYFDRYGQRYSRIKFQKHKLERILPNFDPKLTEWQNMLNNGYNKVFDCGNAVYKYTTT